MTTARDISAQLVWAIVVLFCATLAAVVVIIAVTDSVTAGAMAAAIFGQLGTIVAALATLRVANSVQRDTSDLKNGLLDAKVRSGVADVLPDHLLDPDYVETGQRRRDDERRGEAHGPL